MHRPQYTTEQLVKALRCTCSVQYELDCAGCPFVVSGWWGDDRWLSCNPDRIGLLAADRLELLSRESRL